MGARTDYISYEPPGGPSRLKTCCFLVVLLLLLLLLLLLFVVVVVVVVVVVLSSWVGRRACFFLSFRHPLRDSDACGSRLGSTKKLSHRDSPRLRDPPWTLSGSPAGLRAALLTLLTTSLNIHLLVMLAWGTPKRCPRATHQAHATHPSQDWSGDPPTCLGGSFRRSPQ